MWWSALLPKIKTRWPSLRDPGNIHHPPLFEDFGGHFHVRVCAQLRPVGTATSWAASADCQLDQLRRSRSIDRRCRLDWAHAALNAMIIHCATTCERGAVKASDGGWCTSHVLALLRGGLLVKMVKERHLHFFWPLLFDFLLKRKVSQAL